jgi:hypothetical protein
MGAFEGAYPQVPRRKPFIFVITNRLQPVRDLLFELLQQTVQPEWRNLLFTLAETDLAARKLEVAEPLHAKPSDFKRYIIHKPWTGLRLLSFAIFSTQRLAPPTG